MRRDQSPDRFPRSGTGLPSPAKGWRAAPVIKVLMRLSVLRSCCCQSRGMGKAQRAYTFMRAAGCEETLGELRAGAFALPTSRELVDSTRGADREGLGWSGGTGVDVGRAGLV